MEFSRDEHSAGPDGLDLESLSDAQRNLGKVGRSTIYRLYKQGDLQLVKVGARTCVLRSSREAYVARQLAGGTSTR